MAPSQADGAFCLQKRGLIMAIKVIEYGKKRRIKCYNCESVLEYEKDDIKTVQMGMNEWQKQIKCPVCNETLNVN